MSFRKRQTFVYVGIVEIVSIVYSWKTTELVFCESLCLKKYISIYKRESIYTEQKKKRNNRPPRIFEFKGKTLIISGLLLYDSHLMGYKGISFEKLIFISIKIE